MSVSGVRAKGWATTFVDYSLERMWRRDEVVQHVLRKLVSLDKHTFRNVLHSRRKGEDIVFETNGTLLGDVNVDKKENVVGGFSNMIVAFRSTINVTLVQIRGHAKDPVTTFLESYLWGQVPKTLPLPHEFRMGDPVHVLAASRIVSDWDLARACEILWDMEGWEDDRQRY